MARVASLIAFVATILLAGCQSDIVTTKYLKEVDPKCVYIAPLQSDNAQVGQVIRDVLEKEFIRKKVAVCDAASATVLLTGATFMTTGGKSGNTQEACESVSITARDVNNRVLLSASYDNKGRDSVSQFAKRFGSTLAGKFR